MTEFETTHPLDQDDDAPPPKRRSPPGNSRAYRPLLITGIRVAVASGVVTVLASAASANAPLDSKFATVSDLVFRTAASIVVIAFVCILLAYRIPYFQQHFQFRLQPQAPNAKSMAKSLRGNQFAILAIASVLVMSLVWALTIVGGFVGGAIVFPILVAWITILAIAILVTMVVYNRGIVRAYAIGSLTTFALELPVIMSMLFYLADPYRGGVGLVGMQFAQPIGITLAVMSGLVCAGYVWLLGVGESTTAEP